MTPLVATTPDSISGTRTVDTAGQCRRASALVPAQLEVVLVYGCVGVVTSATMQLMLSGAPPSMASAMRSLAACSVSGTVSRARVMASASATWCRPSELSR